MNRCFLLTLLLIFGAWLNAPSRVDACPYCATALEDSANSAGEDDPLQEARAYNASIYFMVSVPYLIVAIGGTKLYLLSRRADADRQAALGRFTAAANP